MASAPWGHRTEGAGGWPDLGTNRPEFKSRPYCVSLVKALTALSPDSARLLKIPPADRGAWPGVPWGARHQWMQWLSGAHSKQPNAVVSSRMNVGWASSGRLWLRLSPAEAPSAERAGTPQAAHDSAAVGQASVPPSGPRHASPGRVTTRTGRAGSPVAHSEATAAPPRTLPASQASTGASCGCCSELAAAASPLRVSLAGVPTGPASLSCFRAGTCLISSLLPPGHLGAGPWSLHEPLCPGRAPQPTWVGGLPGGAGICPWAKRSGGVPDRGGRTGWGSGRGAPSTAGAEVAVRWTWPPRHSP